MTKGVVIGVGVVVRVLVDDIGVVSLCVVPVVAVALLTANTMMRKSDFIN